jgi:histidine ammonia-lyase
VASLARGYSGVRPLIIETLIALYNAGIMPAIPAQGSVGASGDLAPLAHMTLAMIGVGQVRWNGELCDAQDALDGAGIEPVTLAAKEGLALINGTQVSTALALHGLFLAERLYEAGVVAGALSVDAAKGSDAPFDARIHAVRGQPGQMHAAAMYRQLLDGSEIRRSHLVGDERVQDPYSLRCQPQVMGACLDLIAQCARTLLRRSQRRHRQSADLHERRGRGRDSVGRQFPRRAGRVRGRHTGAGDRRDRRAVGAPHRLADRRHAVGPAAVPGPPAGRQFRLHDRHVTAAALASENKSLAHPASVDSLPTSANQEDHVSMATFAARRLHAMAHNTAVIVGIELLAAAQGIDFHRPLASSVHLDRVHARLRERVAFFETDRFFAPDIEAAKRLVLDGALGADCRELFAPLYA